MAMAYRVDLFEEAGLPTDPDEVNQVLGTWDSYIKAGEQLKEETGAFMFSDVADMYSAIREQGDKQYFETDGTLILEDSPQIQKAWDKSVEAIDIQANIERGTPEWGAALQMAILQRFSYHHGCCKTLKMMHRIHQDFGTLL